MTGTLAIVAKGGRFHLSLNGIINDQRGFRTFDGAYETIRSIEEIDKKNDRHSIECELYRVPFMNMTYNGPIVSEFLE